MAERIKSEFKTDFHCHILPDMDDGAIGAEQSAQMLRALRCQGVRYCVLTPHFYCTKESVQSFLERRHDSYCKLMEVYEPKEMPRLILGAEVHISRNISRRDLPQLCINGSDVILIEFPHTDFEQWMVSEIEQILYAHELRPIIAHTDRVMASFSHKNFQDLLSFDEFIFQINNESLSDFFVRRKLFSSFGDTHLCVLGSDSHDMKHRRPNFDIAQKYLIDRARSAELYESVRQTSRALTKRLFL